MTVAGRAGWRLCALLLALVQLPVLVKTAGDPDQSDFANYFTPAFVLSRSGDLSALYDRDGFDLMSWEVIGWGQTYADTLESHVKALLLPMILLLVILGLAIFADKSFADGTFALIIWATTGIAFKRLLNQRFLSLASIAGLMLTTEALISEVQEDNKPGEMSGGMGGGMGM